MEDLQNEIARLREEVLNLSGQIDELKGDLAKSTNEIKWLINSKR